MSGGIIKKKGYLLKLPVTGIVKKWAKRWCVLYATSHEGVVRLEYYVDEYAERSQIGKRTVPLRDASRIQQTVGDKVHPYVFEFTTQLGQHVFAATSQPDLDEWLEEVKDAVHEDRMKRKMNKSQTKRSSGVPQSSASSESRSTTNREPKDTGYVPIQSSGFSKGSTHTASNISSGTYRVTLEENETTDELGLHGAYNLVLTPTTLSLQDVNTGKLLYKWQYKFLKSFGKQSGRFNFEVGKTSNGGSGSYRCITSCSKEIFGVVNRNIKTIRERLETARREHPPNAPSSSRQSRNSGVVDDTVPGKYRSSKNMEGASPIGESLNRAPQNGQLSEQDVANNYSLAEQEENKTEKEIAALYAKVNKPPKATTTTTTPAQQAEAIPAPAAAQPSSQTNRFSYDTSLDARDSALIQLDGPMLDIDALTPKKPAPDLSNIMDLELHNDFFAQNTSTAATGVDPWGGGGGGQTSYFAGGNVQTSSPWSMQSAGGGQQHSGFGGQPTGYGQPSMGYMGQAGGFAQPAGYAGQSSSYGQQGQSNPWGASAGGGGHQLSGYQSSGYGQGAQAQPPAQPQPQAPQKVLSQEEFDQLWDELCTPTTNF